MLLQLCRGGRRRRPAHPARRRAARLGLQCRAAHARRPLRALRPEGLSRARLEFGGICGHRSLDAAFRHRPLQGTLTVPRSPPATRGFGHVETWVCDLDNTLYPHHLNLWQQVDERIRSFVSDFLKLPKDEAFRLQKDYYKRYGTPLRGLMSEHGVDPDAYLEYVHQ